MADAALEVRDLAFGYGDVPVWEDVSFSLEPGQVAFLTGSNGAGKSTLFRCLAGWLEPDDGKIYVTGEPFGGRTRLAPGTLAFVPDVPSFYDDFTAIEHVELVLAANRAEAARARAERLLERSYQLYLVLIFAVALAALSSGSMATWAVATALALLTARIFVLDTVLPRSAAEQYRRRSATVWAGVVIAAAGVGLAVASGYLASLVPNTFSPVALIAVLAVDLLMLAGAVNCAGHANMAFVLLASALR